MAEHVLELFLSPRIPEIIHLFKVNSRNTRKRGDVFKVNNKDTRTTLLTMTWVPWTYFTPFTGVSSLDFEQENFAGMEYHNWLI